MKAFGRHLGSADLFHLTALLTFFEGGGTEVSTPFFKKGLLTFQLKSLLFPETYKTSDSLRSSTAIARETDLSAQIPSA